MGEVRFRRSALSAGLAATIALIFSAPSLFISPFALFLRPVSDELHWNPAIFPQSLLTVSLLYAVVAPMAGRASDKLGATRIVLVGVVCLALGLFGLSKMSGSLAQLFVCASLLGIAAPLVSPATLAPVLAGWFNRGRGLIMGLILGAAPQVAVAAFSPVISQAIEHFGWRGTYQILAAGALVVSVPVTLAFLKDARDCKAAVAGAEPGAGPPGGLTLKQALCGRAFWLMLSTNALLALVYGGVSGHLVGWRTDHGVSAALGAELLSAMFMGAVVGPIIAGAFADRILRPQVLVPFVSAPLLGLVLLLVSDSQWITLAGSALVGFGFSSLVGQTPVLVTRYYGLRSTGELSGVLISTGGICLGLGPVLVGIARALMGNYESALIACLVVLVIPPICMLLLPPYPDLVHAQPVSGDQNSPGLSAHDTL